MYTIILSGGSGSRLWPISREFYPKQLLKLTDNNTLLQTTFDRIASFLNPSRIIVSTNVELSANVKLQLAKKVKEELSLKLGINATLINPKFITGLDEALLDDLKQEHDIVITLEDGVLDGGFGEKIARFYGSSNMKVLNYGAKKEFTDRVPVEELYERYHLTKELITDDISKLI